MNQWDDLKLFLAVAKKGTLTAAADELGSNVATLHRRLKSFEESFELSLFEKGPRGYRLTSAGEQLLSHAEEIEESIFTAFRAVVGHDQQATGEVRITLPQAMVSLMTPHLVDFSAQFEKIRVILLPDDGLLDLERRTDVAFRFTSQPPETAVGRNLADIAWCRYTSKDTKGLEINHVTQKQQEAVSEKEIMQVQGVAGMLTALKNSAAQGLLPCFVGDLDPELRRAGEPFDAKHQLWLLIHADLKRSARVRALLDFVVPRLLAQKNLFRGVCT
jgi:DNA-binding transcriptional LysR family regulator